ncbi:MucR family transcriptional regulator [Candidatus Entotheonella palauensis]|uniref:MucR family transcriptional regulator n=1 Tax=Candidatus Entotheonella palauensis TaxID=93172 RepID=UPI0015C4B430|nr:MucR family transcriptional regulator [Candidatus Entotheonella palauensis]
MSETLLEMTIALVLAQIEAQHVTPENLQAVLDSTYDTLYRLQTMEGEESTYQDMGLQGSAPAPSALPWKKSITKHTITCLECGASFKQLSRRHLHRHGLDSRSYRIKYGIPSEQPLSARAATARRRELAKSIRPWENVRASRSSSKRARG